MKKLNIVFIVLIGLSLTLGCSSTKEGKTGNAADMGSAAAKKYLLQYNPKVGASGKMVVTMDMDIAIQPSSFKLLSNSSTISDRFNATFQTASNSTSYRLIFHVGSTSASAYTIKIDDIEVGPSKYVFGTPITDWQSYTPTITSNSGTLTNYTATGMWRIVGDSAEYKTNIKFTGSPGTWSGPRVTLKSGHVIDTTRMPDSGQFGTSLGSLAIYDAGTRVFSGSTIYTNTTEVIGYSADPVSADGTLSNTSPMTFASGDVIGYSFSVPILGWSSSVQMSDQTDTRVITARAYRSGNQSVSTAAETDIVFNATSVDDVSGLNTSTGVYTVQVPGKYTVKTSIYISSAASEVFTISIYKTGAQVAQRFFTATSDAMIEVSDVLNCVSGDTIKSTIDSTADTSYTIIGSSVATFTTIERISGPSAISASESINVLANTAATSISTATETVVNGTVMFDSHGAYNSTTGVFTAPISGKYRIATGIRFPSTAIGSGGVQELYVQKNSETNIPIARSNWSSVTVTIMLNGSYTFNLLAGDTLKVKAYNNTTSSLTGENSNFIDIQRVGN
jgi:hypothetical protein